MNISFSSWKAYKECPKKFLKDYIRKDPPTVPVNEYFTLYGKLVEKFFELFSNIWRFNSPHMFSDIIEEKLKLIYEGIIQSSTVNWYAPFCKYSKDDIFNQALKDVCAIMDSQNQNYFLNSKSETWIKLNLKDNHVIRGKIDFIHKDPLSDTSIIFDGKGTDKIGKNVDDNQLFFYALLYYLMYKKMPSGLGFFYYRFNTFVPVIMDINELNIFRAKLSLDVKSMISSEEYKATPSNKSCKYCKYANECIEFIMYKGSKKKPSALPDTEGLVNLSF